MGERLKGGRQAYQMTVFIDDLRREDLQIPAFCRNQPAATTSYHFYKMLPEPKAHSSPDPESLIPNKD